jgi:SpoVK/Ycf46/Vps4 family AAA+-type ATPase
LADDVDIEVFIGQKDDLSGADVKAICTEAGLLALRERRMKVCQRDFEKVASTLRILVSHPKFLFQKGQGDRSLQEERQHTRNFVSVMCSVLT